MTWEDNLNEELLDEIGMFVGDCLNCELEGRPSLMWVVPFPRQGVLGNVRKEKAS